MKKTAIYFVEFSDGKRYYKTDTFWSKHSDPKNAKLHDNIRDVNIDIPDFAVLENLEIPVPVPNHLEKVR